jgi:uncharacterized protein YbjT (DUF2867 family)
MNKKTGIILGATGLTGGLLLEKLIADNTYDTIKLFTRKSTGNKSPKVVEYIIDLHHIEDYKEDFKGDVVFCCIGTTASKTKNKSEYEKIDLGIPYAASKLAAENKIPTYVVISAIGANHKSKIFYNRTKGKMEQAVLSTKIPNTYILRPSLIKDQRKNKRFGEYIANFIFKLTGLFLIGKLKKYKAIDANTIAQAMLNIANSKIKSTILESNHIQEIGKIK